MKYIMTDLTKVTRAKEEVKSGNIVDVFQKYNRLGGQIKNESGVIVKNNYKGDIEGVKEENLYIEEAVVEEEKPKKVVKPATAKKTEVKKAK